MNILSVLLRRVKCGKDKETGRQKKEFKTEECHNKTEKESINVSYHIFLQISNPKNSTTYVQRLL
jgi:hypothetical protein